MIRMKDELFKQRAQEEDSCMISAIGLEEVSAGRGEPKSRATEIQAAPARLAFGTLISFRRRALKISLESLAEKARIELEELLRIDKDLDYRPEPRTVCQLAEVLRLPIPQLLILSGNAVAKDERLNKAAMKFAARSRAVEKLNRDQAEALDEFVKVLVETAKGRK